MIKILGIVGSPRKKGNTHILVSALLDGAKNKGADVDLIHLKNKKIHECDGCHSCWKGKECNKKDDMNRIYKKLTNSDIIVFGTPVYWYGPTALIKAFLDRFVYFNCPENRPYIRGKKAVLVVPFEEQNIETASPLIAMFEKSFNYLEIDLVEKIIVPGVYKRGDILQKTSEMARALNLGERLVL